MTDETPQFEPNEKEMIAHLEHLFGGDLDGCQDGMIELAWSDAKSGQVCHAQLFGTDKIFELVEKACELNRTPFVNVYVGAALRKPGTPDRRCNINDFYAMTAYYADLDKSGAAKGVKQKLAENHKGLLPTAVVLTGEFPHARAQAWWRLQTPDRNPEHCRTITGCIANALDGDHKVVDPIRVMRLGGSIAWPVKDGRIAEMTKVKIYDGRKRAFMEGEVDHAFPAEEYAHTSQTADLQAQGIIKDGLDRITDGRELYMHNVIAGILAGIVRQEARYPDEAELFEKAWPLYVSKVKARSASLEADGRGPTAFKQKISSTLNRVRSGKIKGLESPIEAAIDSAIVRAFSEDVEQQLTLRRAPISAGDFGRHPPPREWIVEEWLPRKNVTALYGDGGIGKTLLAQQLASCIVSGKQWLGIDIKKTGKVLCVFCEDDGDELWRRQVCIEERLNIFDKKSVGNLWLWPCLGEENFLVTYDTDGEPNLSPFYEQLYRTVQEIKPDLLVLDTASDLFGGNENSRKEVNYFIKRVLGSFCVQLGTTVLLLAHPSLSGLNSGTGTGGSTAWNNAVRSRLYLNRKEDGLDDERILTRKKSNYSKAGEGERIDMVWNDGAFTLPTSPDMVDHIEQRSLKKRILEAIDDAWAKNTPITKGQGARPYKDVLPKLLREDPKFVCRAVKELEHDGTIASSQNSNKRGYCVVEKQK